MKSLRKIYLKQLSTEGRPRKRANMGILRVLDPQNTNNFLSDVQILQVQSILRPPYLLPPISTIEIVTRTWLLTFLRTRTIQNNL